MWGNMNKLDQDTPNGKRIGFRCVGYIAEVEITYMNGGKGIEYLTEAGNLTDHNRGCFNSAWDLGAANCRGHYCLFDTIDEAKRAVARYPNRRLLKVKKMTYYHYSDFEDVA